MFRKEGRIAIDNCSLELKSLSWVKYIDEKNYKIYTKFSSFFLYLCF